MVIYNVTTHVESSIEESWLNWMKEKHIPEMLATKKFKTAKIFKIINENDKGGVSYAAQYQCGNKISLEQYLAPMKVNHKIMIVIGGSRWLCSIQT